MAVTQIKSLVQFARGTSTALLEATSPIPDGLVIFTIDDGAFRLGNGVDKIADLEVLFTYNDLISAQGGITGRFEEPIIGDNGNIVVVGYDQATNAIKYSVSNTSLASLLQSISELETLNAGQTDAIATLLSKALCVDISINTAGDDNIITVNSRRYTSSGTTLSGVQTQIASQVSYTPGSHLEEVNFYTNANKTHTIDKTSLADGESYYVDIVGFNNNETSLVYGLTAANPNVSIETVTGSLFKVTFNDVTGGSKDNTPVVLVASIDNVAGTAKVTKAIACLANRQRIIAAVYGGSSADYFRAVTTDSQNNIICAGNTTSEGNSALVVKFDANMNLLSRKYYVGSNGEVFYGVATDSQDNIIGVGSTSSEGSSGEAFIIKFNSNLDIITRKRYGGSSFDTFRAVATDSQDNIICAGYTASGNLGSYDALVVKFNSLLAIKEQRIYGGASVDQFNSVTTDSQDNIICAGYTQSEGTNTDALVVKFDSSLTILYKKRYGGSGNDQFFCVTTDSQDNIICAGYTSSEGTGANNATVIKFSPILEIISNKYIGGANTDKFDSVTIDSQDNIICAGQTSSDGTGSLVIKFDANLNITDCKRYSQSDGFIGVAVDLLNNIICAGSTSSEGSGSTDGLILKLPSAIPSGTFTGTILTGMTIYDCTLPIANGTLVPVDSVLTLGTVSFTLADSALTLFNSVLAFEVDFIN